MSIDRCGLRQIRRKQHEQMVKRRRRRWRALAWQDCCNMCTNHPDCGSWEYDTDHLCVLKTNAPVFIDAPLQAGMTVYSGAPAGETCPDSPAASAS